ncbi:MAG TPA: pantoate--beta-alanine ligase [Ktedonobacteraceae bacterium]|nr:pantoate--beta-alanine ligase [Ktedonobacteraceae bacterium]
MRIIHSLDEMTETARGWLAGGPVGFVPTSGCLHAGHLALVQAARRECEITVVSIFARRDDTGTELPRPGLVRDLTRDIQLLDSAQVDVVFVPRPAEIYPPTFATYVMASGPIVEHLEGAFYSDHARYVTTIFTKLLQLIRPDIAYFGQKNAQQVALVRRLIHDLCIDTSLHVLPTVREGDGLAVSYANSSLSTNERQAACLLYRALLIARNLIEQGEHQVAFLEQTMANVITSSPLLHLEYTAICDPSSFDPLTSLPDLTPSLSSSGFLLAVAARIGSTHLTDNIQFTSNGYWLV